MSRVGVLRAFDRSGWELELERALERANGSPERAAELLGVSERTLRRWRAELREVRRAP